MVNYKRIPSRSDLYQHALLEISFPHELLDIFPNSDAVFKRLNPFSYNDEIAELQEDLTKELWRIVEENLTERQKQVVKLYASGKTQIEIAKELGVNQSSITKCLAPETVVHFDNVKITIEKLFNMWESDPISIKKLNIISLNENTLKLFNNNIVKVMKNEPKTLIDFYTKSDKQMRASPDHKFFTNNGWVQLIDIINNKYSIAVINNDKIEFDQIINNIYTSDTITYDLEVKPPYHNFIANNIVTSNCISGNVDYANRDNKGKPTTYGGVKSKLRKIAKEDKKVNEILQKISDLRDNELF